MAELIFGDAPNILTAQSYEVLAKALLVTQQVRDNDDYLTFAQIGRAHV